MKIRATIEVEVDPQAWAVEYGLSLQDARADAQTCVQRDAQTLIRNHLYALGVLA
ncbi:hypothetical protein I5G97_gp027 [Mycobacterium phage Curiosium]|uniref:Uncharacterized protein n=1 Tax=Mycobacterium phage Curiosium TaxID=2599859 RepID=A0A5J6TTP6_9CAUD|nr:hypothetical protein I5G97_gp027 [Mycobacterium phage Curiosium]QFG14126.1 hypothetical protein PBI_CURIOSIUM_83 [Mycobacterium phage Curiosium]